jgi:hypothetical protein
LVGLLHVARSGELLNSGKWLSVDVDRVVGRLDSTTTSEGRARAGGEGPTDVIADPGSDCDFDLSRHLLLLACLKQIRLSRRRKLRLPPRKRGFVAPLMHHILAAASDPDASRSRRREDLRRAYVRFMRSVLKSTDRETLSAICDYGATCIGGMAGHRLDHMPSACDPPAAIAAREV